MEDQTRELGLWAATAPPPPISNALQGESSCDVTVIGGGFTGISAALHLAEAGVDVTLLEARQIGYGGSGRNVGLVNAGLWVLPDDVLKALGSDYGERLNTVLGASPDLVFNLIENYGISCEALRNGTLHCAHSPAGYRYLRERQAQWARRGAPVVLLEREIATSRIGSSAYYGALLDLRAGTVQPLAYVYGLAHAAVKRGARLHVQSPVTEISRAEGKWVVQTPSGRVRSKAVILATNGYVDQVLPELKQVFIRFNYFQFATRPLPDHVLKTVLPERNGIWDTNTVLSSMRLDRSGRLVVGSVGTVDGFAHRLHEAWARRMLCAVFPQIGSVHFDYAWHGVIAMTRNHMPRFYRLGPDFYTVMSYNGRGIGPGTVFGKLLADVVCKDSIEDFPLPLTEPKPVWLRKGWEFFYEAGARLYHGLQKRILP
uniref:FAD-binding oxidoreductase n=1 Tax=Desulfatirhabdium butyrativorans TaxID=340467 RepID=A0A7C4RGR1_9BACT